MGQWKLSKTSQKTSEVKDFQNPEMKAAERRVSAEVYKFSEPAGQSTFDFSLSRRRSKELQKGGMTGSKLCPTNI